MDSAAARCDDRAMRRFFTSALASLALVVGALAACGSDSTESAGTSTSTTSTASTSAGTGCVDAGGVCGCAGSCATGFHPADPPLLTDCPQPCDTCGACSQECCLPDADAGAGGHV